MYTVPKHDQVHELEDVPFPDPGASAPLLLAGQASLVVAYRSATSSTGRAQGAEPLLATTSLVLFRDCFAVHFGLPNDHAFASHPQAGQTLPPCGAFEVVNSSWIRELEMRNRGHPRHDPLLFQQLRHWVWTFRDSVLECAALSWSTEDFGPPGDRLARMHALLLSDSERGVER
jgi:hypothetical protein